jgi:hypothetical protein
MVSSSKVDLVFSPTSCKPLTLIAGHYGVGKTNLAVNFALDLCKAGKQVTLVDLDVVNPYFRSSDYPDLLAGSGVKLIAPTFARTTLDTPTLSPAIAGAFENREGFVLVDAGGDDVGATALGRYRDQVTAREYDFLYVVNANRNLTQTVAEALEILGEIEAVTGFCATGIVNNTHLQTETTQSTVQAGEEFGFACARESGLPLVCVTVPAGLPGKGLQTPSELRYPTMRYVTPPW